MKQLSEKLIFEIFETLVNTNKGVPIEEIKDSPISYKNIICTALGVNSVAGFPYRAFIKTLKELKILEIKITTLVTTWKINLHGGKMNLEFNPVYRMTQMQQNLLLATYKNNLNKMMNGIKDAEVVDVVRKITPVKKSSRKVIKFCTIQVGGNTILVDVLNQTGMCIDDNPVFIKTLLEKLNK